MEEKAGGSLPFVGRAFLSIRGVRVVSMEQRQEQDLDHFHSHVADRLLDLLPAADSSHNLLTLPFLHKLLDAFLSCDHEFRSLLRDRDLAGLLSRPPADRAVADLLGRAVKWLDICNAASLALDSVRHSLRLADTAASAILSCDGPLGRSRRALTKLLASFPDSSSRRSERSGSSGRSSGIGNLRSHGSRTYSSGGSIPPVPANLGVARGGETGGAGIALAGYAMSSILTFTMWVLAAAFICQDLAAVVPSSPVSPQQHLPWAGTMVLLQDRMAAEWRRRKGEAVQLAEMEALERWGKVLMVAVVREGGRAQAEDAAAELAEACRRLEEGLGPLERQVREVFHRVVCSRAEVLRFAEQSTQAAAAAAAPNPPQTGVRP
ncbi:protein ROH1A-like [Curcuma longa]|uniref:protein ROH1A-like n=1 Tax=Curcuma longa TaxID=136217 RepID=UPI003D9E6C8C